jgi:hypothetical protein
MPLNFILMEIIMLFGYSVADPDPGSNAVLPLWSGMNCFPDPPDPEGMFFDEIFLRILVLLFFTNKTCSWNHKEQEKGWFYFSSLFLCTVGYGIRCFLPPGSRMKNLGIRIRDPALNIPDPQHCLVKSHLIFFVWWSAFWLFSPSF